MSAEDVPWALVNVVLADGELDEIAAKVATLLDATLIITAADGELLASYGATGDVFALHARSQRGTGPQRATTPPSDWQDSLSSDRYVAVPVVAGGHGHGYIVVHRADGPLPESYLHTLEWGAAVVALVMTRQQAVAAVEGKYRADFLRDVVTGRAGQERAVTHAAALGWDFDRPVVAVVAEPDCERADADDERAAREHLLTGWLSALRHRDPTAAVAGFSSEVVAVVGAPQPGGTDHAGKGVVGELCDHAGARGRFSVGVSRVVTAPAGLPEAYRQAAKALRVGRQLHGVGAVAHFDQLGVYRLLSLVPDTDELHAFVRDTLGELACDEPELLDLRHTLQVLLETNLNVAETARKLHFHYNTLRYRIGKLERQLGPFTQDPHQRLNLMLALHVLRMRGI